MDIRFIPHNTHLEEPGAFVKRDPHLKQLHQQPLIHRAYLLNDLPCCESPITEYRSCFKMVDQVPRKRRGICDKFCREVLQI